MPLPVILAGIGHYVVNQATDYIKTNAGQFIRNRLADAGLQDTWLFRQLQGANEWQQGNTPTSFSIRIGRKTRMKYTSENTRWKLKGNREGVSFDISWGQPDQANAYAPEQHNASHAHGVPYHQHGVHIAPDGFPIYRQEHYGPDILPTATAINDDWNVADDLSADAYHSDIHFHGAPYRQHGVDIAPDGFPIYRKEHYGQDIAPTSPKTVDNDWDFDYDPNAFGPDVRPSSETLAANANANRASSHNERANWVSSLNSRFDAADFIADEVLPSRSLSSASTIANAVADSFTSVSNSLSKNLSSFFSKPFSSSTQRTVDRAFANVNKTAEDIGNRLSAYFR